MVEKHVFFLEESSNVVSNVEASFDTLYNAVKQTTLLNNAFSFTCLECGVIDSFTNRFMSWAICCNLMHQEVSLHSMSNLTSPLWDPLAVLTKERFGLIPCCKAFQLSRVAWWSRVSHRSTTIATCVLPYSKSKGKGEKGN